MNARQRRKVRREDRREDASWDRAIKGVCLRLSVPDTQRLDEILAEPFVPNEALKRASVEYEADIASGRLKATWWGKEVR